MPLAASSDRLFDPYAMLNRNFVTRGVINQPRPVQRGVADIGAEPAAFFGVNFCLLE